MPNGVGAVMANTVAERVVLIFDRLAHLPMIEGIGILFGLQGAYRSVDANRDAKASVSIGDALSAIEE